MSLAKDLLEQAGHLARRERKRPRQASLRRAVSAAYYGLFHLLIADAVRNAAPAEPEGLRILIRRAFTHCEMKTVCQNLFLGDQEIKNLIAKGKPGVCGRIPASTQQLLVFPLENELLTVLSVFVEMQDARQTADYDTVAMFSRLDVLSKIGSVQGAFENWSAVRSSSNAAVFLAAMLLQKGWNK